MTTTGERVLTLWDVTSRLLIKIGGGEAPGSYLAQRRNEFKIQVLAEATVEVPTQACTGVTGQDIDQSAACSIACDERSWRVASRSQENYA